MNIQDYLAELKQENINHDYHTEKSRELYNSLRGLAPPPETQLKPPEVKSFEHFNIQDRIIGILRTEILKNNNDIASALKLINDTMTNEKFLTTANLFIKEYILGDKLTLDEFKIYLRAFNKKVNDITLTEIKDSIDSGNVRTIDEFKNKTDEIVSKLNELDNIRDGISALNQTTADLLSKITPRELLENKNNEVEEVLNTMNIEPEVLKEEVKGFLKNRDEIINVLETSNFKTLGSIISYLSKIGYNNISMLIRDLTFLGTKSADFTISNILTVLLRREDAVNFNYFTKYILGLEPEKIEPKTQLNREVEAYLKRDFTDEDDRKIDQYIRLYKRAIETGYSVDEFTDDELRGFLIADIGYDENITMPEKAKLIREIFRMNTRDLKSYERELFSPKYEEKYELKEPILPDIQSDELVDEVKRLLQKEKGIVQLIESEDIQEMSILITNLVKMGFYNIAKLLKYIGVESFNITVKSILIAGGLTKPLINKFIKFLQSVDERFTIPLGQAAKVVALEKLEQKKSKISEPSDINQFKNEVELFLKDSKGLSIKEKVNLLKSSPQKYKLLFDIFENTPLTEYSLGKIKDELLNFVTSPRALMLVNVFKEYKKSSEEKQSLLSPTLESIIPLRTRKQFIDAFYDTLLSKDSSTENVSNQWDLPALIGYVILSTGDDANRIIEFFLKKPSSYTSSDLINFVQQTAIPRDILNEAFTRRQEQEYLLSGLTNEQKAEFFRQKKLNKSPFMLSSPETSLFSPTGELSPALMEEFFSSTKIEPIEEESIIPKKKVGRKSKQEVLPKDWDEKDYIKSYRSTKRDRKMANTAYTNLSLNDLIGFILSNIENLSKAGDILNQIKSEPLLNREVLIAKYILSEDSPLDKWVISEIKEFQKEKTKKAPPKLSIGEISEEPKRASKSPTMENVNLYIKSYANQRKTKPPSGLKGTAIIGRALYLQDTDEQRIAVLQDIRDRNLKFKDVEDMYIKPKINTGKTDMSKTDALSFSGSGIKPKTKKPANKKQANKKPANKKSKTKKTTRIVFGSGIINENLTQKEKKSLISRFKLLRGQILAGNNNKDIVNEFKTVIIELLTNKIIDNKEYKQLSDLYSTIL